MNDGTIDVSAYATITANSTHWFSCYKQVQSSGQVIQLGFHICSVAGLLPSNFQVPQPDTDYPIKDTTGEDRMYSCMMSETTMILAVSSSDTQKYSLYSLDTANAFNITSKTSTDGSGYVMSMACRDQVILVATQNKLDYWVWDDGVSAVKHTSCIHFSPATDWLYIPADLGTSGIESACHIAHYRTSG